MIYVGVGQPAMGSLILRWVALDRLRELGREQGSKQHSSMASASSSFPDLPSWFLSVTDSEAECQPDKPFPPHDAFGQSILSQQQKGN